MSVRTLSVLIKPSCMNKNSSSELRFRRENIASIKTTHDTRGLCIASKVANTQVICKIPQLANCISIEIFAAFVSDSFQEKSVIYQFISFN